MASLVEDLQRDALNHDVSATELLQKSLVVATKLKLDDFAIWVRRELDGYEKEEVPEYRVLHGNPQVFNPYRGYQPLNFGDVEQAKRFSKMHFNTPIGELEHDLIGASKSGSSAFHISYEPSIEKMLMDAIDYSLQPSLHISTSQFQRVLNAVRKIILEWSLKLEADGITGEGMSFTTKEKERAQAVTYNIKNYIQGNIHDSQIQIETENSTQTTTIEFDLGQITKLIEALKSTIDVIGIDQSDKQELQSEILTLEAQTNSKKPKNSIIAEAISSVRRILEGASENLVASGLLNQIDKFFGT